MLAAVRNHDLSRPDVLYPADENSRAEIVLSAATIAYRPCIPSISLQYVAAISSDACKTLIPGLRGYVYANLRTPVARVVVGYVQSAYSAAATVIDNHEPDLSAMCNVSIIGTHIFP